MTTLNEYLHALSQSNAENRFVKIDEEIQKGADPLRKGNEALGLFTEKRTYKLHSLEESDVPEVPVADVNLDVVRALIAEGWTVKDMTVRLEKPKTHG